MRAAAIALAFIALLCRETPAQAGTCVPHRARSEWIGAAIGVAGTGAILLMRDDTRRVDPREGMSYVGVAAWAGVMGATLGNVYENRRCPSWMRGQPETATRCAVAVTRGTVAGTAVGGAAGVLMSPFVLLPLMPAVAISGGSHGRIEKTVVIVTASGAAIGGITGVVREFRRHCAR